MSTETKQWFISPDIKILGDEIPHSFITKKEAEAFLRGLQIAAKYFAEPSEFEDYKVISKYEYFQNQ